MKQRAIEILFRHKFLLLLPLIIIVPIMVAVALQPAPKTWQSTATLWIDEYKPLASDDRLGYAPAKSQEEILNGFISSRSFARSVLSQTDIAPLLDTPVGEERALALFWRSTRAQAVNNTFTRLVVQTPNAELTYQIATAVLNEFQAEMYARLETQTKVATDLYAGAAAQSAAALEKARTDLAAYLAAHPELTARETATASGPSARERDVTYARLADQVDNALRAFNAVNGRYEGLRAQGVAGLEGQQLTIVVVDSPELPQKPFQARRLARLQLPLLGLVLAGVISAVIATVLILTTRAVFGSSDIMNLTGVPVLGEMPELRRRRWIWQRASRDAVRAQLSAVARPMPVHGPITGD